MLEISKPILPIGLLLTSVHDRSVPPSKQIAEHHELISTANQLGFNLVVAGQHFAAPTLRYLQPVPYLATIAAQFPGIQVATGVILLPLHHPVSVAEELATLDVITNGRSIIGLGIGYLQDEFDAFEIDRTTRTRRFEESIKIIRALWSGEPLTHHGEFFHFDEVQTSTLPVQQPHPPIWIGAQSEPSVRRAARLADAWYVPPFPTNRELISLYKNYLEEREAHGKIANTAIPVRRELYIAKTVVEAKTAISAGAASRYATYSSWGVDFKKSLGGDEWLDDRFILGDPETVANNLNYLMSEVEHSNFIYKPQWPGQSHSQAMTQLELFGTNVVPLLSPPTP